MATPAVLHRPLTRHQRRLLLAIQEFHAEFGYAPTIREVQQRLGNASPASVHVRLSKAREQKLVNWVDGQVRTLTITPEGKWLLLDSPPSPMQIEQS